MTANVLVVRTERVQINRLVEMCRVCVSFFLAIDIQHMQYIQCLR